VQEMFSGSDSQPGIGSSWGGNENFDQLAAKAEAARLARLAGYKSPLRRLLDRLLPHRQQPGADSRGSYDTLDDSGR
jgi:hypothetical protein